MNEITITRQTTGKTSESLAADFLRQQGFVVRSTNYRAGRYGEIDLVCQDKDTLVFVEVRSRRTSSGGLPEESLSFGKKNRLLRAINHYLQKCPADIPYRVDVITVLWKKESPPQIEHFANVTPDW